MTTFRSPMSRAHLDRDDVRNSVANIKLTGIVFLGEIDRIAAAKI
jgi:ATP-dependent protease HslVU (ClpYQ) ATPase subunit